MYNVKDLSQQFRRFFCISSWYFQLFVFNFNNLRYFYYMRFIVDHNDIFEFDNCNNK